VKRYDTTGQRQPTNTAKAGSKTLWIIVHAFMRAYSMPRKIRQSPGDLVSRCSGNSGKLLILLRAGGTVSNPSPSPSPPRPQLLLLILLVQWLAPGKKRNGPTPKSAGTLEQRIYGLSRLVVLSSAAVIRTAGDLVRQLQTMLQFVGDKRRIRCRAFLVKMIRESMRFASSLPFDA
jgi:hypothetical protein